MAIYLISDVHFGHENIIEYTDRPFQTEQEMNESIIQNWNETVDPEDTVIYGGDFTVTDQPEQYANRLNGTIIYLVGNHDDFSSSTETLSSVLKSTYFSNREYEFYYSHYPSNHTQHPPHYAATPDWFSGWNIHGHVHNNNLTKYPFINAETFTINVSCEVLDYKPISVANLCSLLDNRTTYKTRDDATI